jgi:hypothetical protein
VIAIMRFRDRANAVRLGAFRRIWRRSAGPAQFASGPRCSRLGGPYTSPMAGGYEKHGLAVSLRQWFETNRDLVPRYLVRYFHGVGENPRPFAGRLFEEFLLKGHKDRFAPTDIFAAQALSVTIPTEAVQRLLYDDAEMFNTALRALPPSDFGKVERSVFDRGGAAVELFKLLDALPGIGTTKATKLMAAKRPDLIPIQDAFVQEELMVPDGKFWLPMYDQLADESLRDFIDELTKAAASQVALLRRIDVAVWMHVNDRKNAARRRAKGKR